MFDALEIDFNLGPPCITAWFHALSGATAISGLTQGLRSRKEAEPGAFRTGLGSGDKSPGA
jgi:hypothetical protein